MKALVSWSGGKDAAWSLHRARGEYEIAALLTTVSEVDDVVPIHGVSHALIAAQAEALGLPLWTVRLPQPCSNVNYTERLLPVWRRAVDEGIGAVIFGDLFLADIRAWREQLLAATTLQPVFPLWMEPTRRLADEMVQGGLRATVCAVDETKLQRAVVGRAFDSAFLESLPPSIDPCGENGEFHTFVRYMPGFSHEVTGCLA